ncbi:cytochrome P450, putative [Ricinus communis]|uniref:Cytochrome P450, putative n=1 Tax=Ricinus communis TaxID=3988 RepID=B9S315_RICCO|nr:cytochrome P450, putative [Ricinus communis]
MAMDISNASSSWAIFCLAIAILISTMFLKHKLVHNKIKRRLPPGELGLPWIGETMEFFQAQRSNRLFEEFVQPRIAKYGNIFKTRLMGSPTIVVNGAEANRFFLSNEFKLVISSWPTSTVQLMGKNSIMEKQGDQHRCIRGLIATTLSNARLEVLVPKMCQSVEVHLEKYWNGDKNVSLYRSAKALTFTIVFECLLGIKVDAGTLSTFEWILDGVFATPFSLPGSRFSKAKKARKEVEKMLVELVREKRKEMEEGLQRVDDGVLLCQLIGGMIRGEIREEEVIDNVVLLVFAAHDTTSFAIAMTFKMLALHPDCYALLLQGPRLCAGYQLAKLNILIFVHYVVTRYDWSLIYPDEQITMDPLPFPSHGMPIKISANPRA